MARNVKPEYLRKLLAIDRNGYKFDIANYLHNPAFGYEYPSFKKIIAEDELTVTFRRVFYFKYYGGDGAYKAETFTASKSKMDKSGWTICQNCHEITLEESKRFNLNKLLTFCDEQEG